MCYQFPATFSSKHLHAKAQKQVFKNGNVAFHHLSFDFAVSSHVADVQQRGVRKGNGLQKPGEVSNVADESFHLDLFSDVECSVGAQCLFRFGSPQNQGKHPKLQCPFQMELLLQLCGHEWMQGPENRSSSKKIHSSPFQLPRTRTCEYEPDSSLTLDQT